MDIREAELVVSAPSKAHWPESELPEIVLAGRSNVGKSSLINTLCGRKALAYVGNTPGKTRLLNFFDIDHRFMFVDVPGYGFANASKQMLIQFGEMMEDYFSSRSQLKGLILLVDMRHAPTEDDITMADYARYYEIPFVVAATKLDKVPRSQQSKQINVIAKALACAPEAIIPFSSITKQGREELLEAIDALFNPEEPESD